MMLDQGYEVALGAEAWAADILRRDKASGSKTDDPSEEWALDIPPIPIEGGEVQGHLDDMQGRFNLNSLITLEDGTYKVDKAAVNRLARLLEVLDLEAKWASVIADWIDTDSIDGFPNGAEDSTYTSQTPPYRSANMPITRVSELLSIAEFGLERYQRLEPHVTALPIGTSINLCTATPELLDSLVEGQRQFTQARESTAETRKERCFPTKADFQQPLNPDQRKELIDGRVVDETTNYFRSTVWVSIGTTQLTLYSLLYRTNGDMVRPILRSLGTP
jgi:general secretion pathway protein K